MSQARYSNAMALVAWAALALTAFAQSSTPTGPELGMPYQAAPYQAAADEVAPAPAVPPQGTPYLAGPDQLAASSSGVPTATADQAAGSGDLTGPVVERLPPVEPVSVLPEEVLAPQPVLAPAAGPATSAQVVLEEALEAPEPAPAEILPKIWSGSFDLGLNGSNGNTDLFNFRFNLAAIRETEATKLTLKSNYMQMHSEGEETGNRLFFEGRNEWKFGESPWSIYIHETTEYDEFRNWRSRVGIDAGLGYTYIKTDRTSLTLRFGPSAAKEFRGPDQEWVPELAYGLQLEHKLTELQKLTFQIDYFPDLREIVEFRMNTQATWEIVIDKENNLSLKLSAISRYDSTPEGDSPDDLDYAATLLWAF